MLKAVSAEEEENKKRLISPIPEKYMDTSTYLFLLGLVGMIAILYSMLSKTIFNSFGVAFKIFPTIFALLFGIVAGEIGLLERKSLQKANCFGFFVVVSVVGVMGGLVNSSMEEISSVLFFYTKKRIFKSLYSKILFFYVRLNFNFNLIQIEQLMKHHEQLYFVYP